ncbi:MAG: alpha/beta fold hydrolase [Pseudomonadota bacterium]
MQQEIIRVNGIDMNVATAGTGRPVLLLHGFPDTHRVWAGQVAPLLAAGYRVIAPDLRGYGASAAPASVAAYSIAILRTDITALLDALAIDKLYLVGHDWGAIIGWQLCMFSPERIERFAALSVGHPNAYAAAGLAQKLKAWYAVLFQLPGIAEAMVGSANLLALKPHAVDDEQLADWRHNFARPGRLTAALNYYRANRGLAQVKPYPPIALPVMGVWSEGDPALTENQMKDSAQHVHGPFRYEKIEGEVGHWLQLRESARLNRLLIEFGASTLS